MKRIPLLSTLLLSLAAGAALAQAPATGPLLIENARVAVIGDSITEQKLYSKYIECYLLACTGRQDIRVFQFGWSGERADGFANRLANDLAVFQPTVATTCYGMNDGSYQPYNDAIGSAYEANMRRVIAGLKAAGVQRVVVGSPGGVDPDFFTRPTLEGAVYNDNLAHLRDIAKKLAGENGLAFANVHDTMMEALPKAKAALGKGYAPFGGDGFHPAPAGQLLMAMAFLKGLGLDGNIGTVTVDLAAGGAATASDGHRVLGATGGAVELESTRWPFCFDASPSDAGSTRSILPHCTFNQDLNRLTLVVKGLTAAKAKVSWGGETKEYTREQLEAGINLAADYTATPFDGAFKGLIDAVGAKQAYETLAIKNLVTHFRGFADEAKADPEFGAALDTLKRKIGEKHARLDEAARAKVVPVKHTIRVEPLP
ncbi:MAG: SGNH/GDSL hydrolase family protein [Verrucomicrobiales bacterium]|nr:SGNH/GDSL hydrolase family protein [Verrucomicrobiales bacterium]